MHGQQNIKLVVFLAAVRWRRRNVKALGVIRAIVSCIEGILIEDFPLCLKYINKIKHVLCLTQLYVYLIIILLLATSFGLKRPSSGQHLQKSENAGACSTKTLCWIPFTIIRGQLKCDGTRTETIFRLSAKRTSPFKSAGASAQSTAGSQGVLDTPCSELVWRVLATHSIHQFPLHFPSRASPCAITFQLESTSLWMCYL